MVTRNEVRKKVDRVRPVTDLGALPAAPVCTVNDCHQAATCQGIVAIKGDGVTRAESVMMCPTCAEKFGLPRTCEPLVNGTDSKGRSPIRPSAQGYANSFPCIHRSGPPATAKCTTCGDEDRVTLVWQCAIHGQCTAEGTGVLEGRSEKLMACLACEDRAEELPVG